MRVCVWVWALFLFLIRMRYSFFLIKIFMFTLKMQLCTIPYRKPIRINRTQLFYDFKLLNVNAIDGNFFCCCCHSFMFQMKSKLTNLRPLWILYFMHWIHIKSNEVNDSIHLVLVVWSGFHLNDWTKIEPFKWYSFT